MPHFLGRVEPQGSRSTADLGLHTPGSWRLLGRERKSMSSMMFEFDADGTPPPLNKTMPVPGRRKGGLMQTMKRLYRSSSSDLRRYAGGMGIRPV